MNYRKDIDLLKGYCILCIIFYHYNFLRFHYGYLAVVVFINISGYLSSKSKNNNSISNIAKRYLRISPSYYTFILFTLLYRMKINTLNETDSEDAVYAFTYIYNLRLIYSESNYFTKDNKSQFKHLWYLSVLLQLYIIQIILLIFSTEYRLHIIIIYFSFIYNYYEECIISNYLSHYNTLIRIWYYIPCNINYKFNIMFSTKLILIVIFCLVKIYNIFINTIAISVLSHEICSFYNNNNINNIIYNKLIWYLGKISYSLYLYHYFFITYSNNTLLNILLSFVFSAINDLIIEEYFKYFKIIQLIITYVVIIKVYTSINSIFEKRRRNSMTAIINRANRESFNLWCSHCHININKLKKYNNILLVGDSHLEQWIPAIIPYSKSHKLSLHYFYIHLLIDDYSFLYNKYFKNTKIKWLLILYCFYTSKVYNNKFVVSKLIDIISYFNNIQPNSIYIEDSPMLKKRNICLECINNLNKICNTVKGVNITVYPRILPNISSTIYISFNDIICNERICPCLVNGVSVYDTMSHLSPIYTKSFSKYFTKTFSTLLRNVYMHREYNKRCNFYVHGKYYYRNC